MSKVWFCIKVRKMSSGKAVKEFWSATQPLCLEANHPRKHALSPISLVLEIMHNFLLVHPILQAIQLHQDPKEVRVKNSNESSRGKVEALWVVSSPVHGTYIWLKNLACPKMLWEILKSPISGGFWGCWVQIWSQFVTKNSCSWVIKIVDFGCLQL